MNAVTRKNPAVSNPSAPRTTATPTTIATSTPAIAPTVPRSGSLALAPIRASTNTETSKPSRSTAKNAIAARARPEPPASRRAALAPVSRVRSLGKRRIQITM